MDGTPFIEGIETPVPRPHGCHPGAARRCVIDGGGPNRWCAQKLTRRQQELVERHLWVVDEVTTARRRRVARHVHDQLESIGRVALVMAALAFDEACGTPFATFAWKQVSNQLTIGLRKRSVAGLDPMPAHHAEDDLSTDDAYLDGMHAIVTGEASRLASCALHEKLHEQQERDRALEVLKHARARLEPKRRTIVRLRHDAGLEWKHIAAIMGRSQSTVRAEHGAALRCLRRELQRAGFSMPAARQPPSTRTIPRNRVG